MDISKNFEFATAEAKWTTIWKEKRYFNSTPDNRPAYSIVIPPPNVTGVLHMGHTLNETVQDILARKARMDGYNVCWVPGSDHASIATEAKVVQMLKEKGIDKNTLTRTEFLKYAFEWKEKYGGIIYNQIERLGCSVDWDRVNFTMDDHYYKAVIKTFVSLYKEGKIYRGARMINWDPAAKTALSDEEVEYKEVTGRLFHIKYVILNETETPTDAYITVATGRPETIMGDVAICVHPDDARYSFLKGKKVLVPLVNRAIPVIFDTYIDQSFGTGVLKVTPAHDINDYNLGIKHNLPIIDTLNDDGTISAVAGIFVGLDRFVARKKAIEQLSNEGLLIKETEHPARIGYSQRSGAVVEPKISTQWFVNMQALAQPALEQVVNGNIEIHPGDRFLATYKYWLENVKDWCISRQLWWGQQIPAWYDEAGIVFVAENEEEAKALAIAANGNNASDNITLSQDKDVLDTWFSSWLWPIEVFDGITNPNNEAINYYYPTSVLVTGQDIIFFWVARMVMAGMHFMQEKPFSHVYFTGMVRDKQGRKMSKSLGNSPDLLALIDQYGADSVRFGIMIASPAGNDLLFDESALEQGRNFTNKIWNALKLITIWKDRLDASNEANTNDTDFAVAWINNRIAEASNQINDLMRQFRLSEALKVVYSLIWDDFCSWYLEWVKPGFEQKMPSTLYVATITAFEQLLQLLHPFMPFVTEEIYHLLQEQEDDLSNKLYAPTYSVEENIIANGAWLKQLITTIREARVKNNIKPKDVITLYIQASEQNMYQNITSIFQKQVNASTIHFTNAPIDHTIVVAIEKDKLYIESSVAIDIEAQKKELLKDLEHQKGFLQSVLAKLNNERFVQNAKPAVIELEQKKKADAEARIQTIVESLKSLEG